ncbi:hypothetical protein FisN_9Hu359 [Fistulifera solaris]|uniref:N-acetyltransferase domain-containing protein n=1 Tax=Fistulifera solaris TaxID=1519565 RepID=A0A1Z5KD02_FISSO|nr:hypothetical protein FisN_9Hu359 [Fistulifera solaris]|eukprot:GAX24107.1 hypothetical protein FisN_9Hu359 [Fistulifera solaris]
MERWRFMSSLAALIIVKKVAFAWYITPPRHNNEWKELVQLLVQTFDSPRRNGIDKLRWSLHEQALTEANTFRQYTQTAKRMRGKKYNLFVAKELGRVIGMAGVGINNGARSEKRPTIGLICVEEAFRQKGGVAADLVTHCEHLVRNVWNETVLFAEVEPTISAALQFFRLEDFHSVDNQTMNVNVRRGLRMEKMPDLLLLKKLRIDTRRVRFDLNGVVGLPLLLLFVSTTKQPIVEEHQHFQKRGSSFIRVST